MATALIAGLPEIAASAGTASATPSTTTYVEAPDWAGENLADSFDFDNPEDLPPASTSGLTNPVVADGRMSFGATSGGFFQPVRTLGSILRGRDSEQFPITATRYNRISIRMYSGASTPQAGGVTWFTCWGQVPGCAAAKAFTVFPGWNTYEIDPTQGPYLFDSIGGWSGAITGLRVTPSGSTPSSFPVHIDWLRIHEATAPVTVSVEGGAGSEVWWDSDADPTNNDPSRLEGSSAGRLGTGLPSGGSVSFNAAAYPPGEYRFYTKEGGQVGAYSDPLVIAPRPQPEMLTPSVLGGDDYATTLRGDAWDFSQPTDAVGINNFRPTFGGGLLTGSGSGLAAAGDPYFYLPTAGPIDATTWHRLSFRISYDGPMGLDDAPGGGMVMRLIWGVDNGSGGISWHDGRDVVVTPGWQTVSFDLKTDPPSLIEDETSADPVGWGGPSSRRIRYIRFDPHEDPGGRTWRIDHVRLARNERADPNFTFTFRDNAWQSGTTAEVWIDDDRAGFDGTKLASGLSMNPGTNSFQWNAKGTPSGTYWPYLVFRSPDGTVSRAYATGSLDVDVPSGIPFGSLDMVSAPPGTVRVAGWAIDPDTAVDEPIDVHVYANGRFLGAGTASLPRPDVGRAIPGWGSLHGFDMTFPASAGAQTVCAYAINVGSGGNPLLGCRTVTVRSGSPFGTVDAARPSGPGKIGVAGWAIDPDTAASIGVHVYVNGNFSGSTIASNRRDDVAAAFAGYGPNHGYSLQVPSRSANNVVCAYGINTGRGGNALLGCRNVRMPVDPFGSLDLVRRTDARSVTLAGWAIDPDATGPNEVHVYVDGVGAAALTADRLRSDVGQVYPAFGPRHGFAATLGVTPGPHVLCAYAVNSPGTAGGNALLGCRRI
ncbi:hypothetical protein [Rhabdothermincola salaria]|uniref:hypothetical protein n=1 Tax=Rhabdothermincola salaria TaxID=2903142 RepID=UPI001E499681|nr:hypothetical protein [Rhabdothermincola salaria]MCD9623366.1 hypothetical protein [Rhabdothermincola salaria]